MRDRVTLLLGSSGKVKISGSGGTGDSLPLATFHCFVLLFFLSELCCATQDRLLESIAFASGLLGSIAEASS